MPLVLVLSRHHFWVALFKRRQVLFCQRFQQPRRWSLTGESGENSGPVERLVRRPRLALFGPCDIKPAGALWGVDDDQGERSSGPGELAGVVVGEREGATGDAGLDVGWPGVSVVNCEPLAGAQSAFPV